MSQEVVEVMQAVKYHSYPEYTNTGLTWLGAIPKHWELKRAKFVFKRVQRPVRVEDEIVTAFRDGQVTLRSNRRTEGFTNALQEIGYQGVRSGDLLIHAMDGFAGAIGISDSEGKCSPVCSVCIPISTDGVNPHYYGYLVRQLAVTGFITSLSKGIRERSTEFRFSEFSPLELALPPVDEQQTIAAFLDYETARIDRLIAQQQRLIELLKEKRQAVISHAVTKGLNPNAPMKNSGVEWLGQVPEHWAVMRLKHLIKSLESGCSVNAADVPAKEDELGVLKTSCVYTRRFRASENKTVVMEDFSRVKCPVRKGAIIISRMNTPELVGASALVDTDASNLFLPDRLWQTIFNDQFEVNPEFLAHFMTVEGFRNQISLSAEGASSSMQNIAKEDYLAINALLPLLEEQIEIVDYIKESEARFLRLEAQAMNAIELMKERRIALISAAVTGKIDLRGWTQPAEEVAA